jgi:hypothetical protein
MRSVETAAWSRDFIAVLRSSLKRSRSMAIFNPVGAGKA